MSELENAILKKLKSPDEPMVCFVCNKPIERENGDFDAHWCHEPDCKRDDVCDCDLYAHPECCPVCRRIVVVEQK